MQTTETTTEAKVITSEDLPAGALDRDLTIKLIRFNLKQRSGKSWSVKGGRGTAWGWLTISAPPARRIDNELTREDAEELGGLLGKRERSYYTGEYDENGYPLSERHNRVHPQGEDVAADSEWYRHYIDASAGVESQHGTPQYWD